MELLESEENIIRYIIIITVRALFAVVTLE